MSAALALTLISARVMALESSEVVKASLLMQSGTTWDGKPNVYPKGPAQVTAMRVEIAPGAETGWHRHDVPSFAVMLEGELEVRLEDGRTRQLRAGDVLAEVVDVRHNGRNTGAHPVKLVVFYAGAQGKQLTVKAR